MWSPGRRGASGETGHACTTLCPSFIASRSVSREERRHRIARWDSLTADVSRRIATMVQTCRPPADMSRKHRPVCRTSSSNGHSCRISPARGVLGCDSSSHLCRGSAYHRGVMDRRTSSGADAHRPAETCSTARGSRGHPGSVVPAFWLAYTQGIPCEPHLSARLPQGTGLCLSPCIQLVGSSKEYTQMVLDERTLSMPKVARGSAESGAARETRLLTAM